MADNNVVWVLVKFDKGLLADADEVVGAFESQDAAVDWARNTTGWDEVDDGIIGEDIELDDALANMMFTMHSVPVYRNVKPYHYFHEADIDDIND